MRRAGDIDRLQRLVAADAVLGMDDEIARRQVGHLGDELVEVAPAARRPRQPVAEDVLLAEQHAVASVAKPCSSGRTASPTAVSGNFARASPSATRRSSATPRSRSTRQRAGRPSPR